MLSIHELPNLTVVYCCHFQIKDKIEQLQTEWESLIEAWEAKNAQCEAVLDSQLLTRDLDQAEAWLNSRTPVLKDETFLVSS